MDTPLARVLSLFLLPAVLAAAPPPLPTRAAATSAAAEPVAPHPEWDARYTELIRQATTSPEFSTALVDHLPASATVPTPLAFLGHIAGAPDRLTYAEDVHAYLRALAAASPRVKVFPIGQQRRGARNARGRDRGRGHDRHRRPLPGDHAAALRPAPAERRRGAGLDRGREADLLADRGHPLAGDRQPRDADGARLSARRRRHADDPRDPRQPDHADHAGARGGRARPHGGPRALAPGQPDSAGCRRSSTGDTTSATTTTATRSGWRSR